MFGFDIMTVTGLLCGASVCAVAAYFTHSICYKNWIISYCNLINNKMIRTIKLLNYRNIRPVNTEKLIDNGYTVNIQPSNWCYTLVITKTNPVESSIRDELSKEKKYYKNIDFHVLATDTKGLQTKYYIM